MSYVHDDGDSIAEARRLLAELWDEAREIAVLKRQLGRGDTLPGGVGWLPPECISGVHLYEEADGWRCDLTLDGVPEGKPDCIGSPTPLRSREMASTFALAVLCDVVLANPAPVPPIRLPVAVPFAVSHAPVRRDVPEHAFEYDGIAHVISARVVRELREAGIDKVSDGYVRRRLEEVRRDLAKGGPITHEAIARMNDDGRRAFLTVCTMASLKGIRRWPEDASNAA